MEEARIQDQLAEEVVDKQLSVRALEARIHQLGRARQGQDPAPPPPGGLPEGRRRGADPGLARPGGNQAPRQGRQLQIHYASEAELDRIFEGLKKGPGSR